MERPEDPDRLEDVEDAEEAAAERIQHKHPAEGEGPEAGFAEGEKRFPGSPEEQADSDFARGERTGPESELEEKGRFSEGIEQEPKHSPDKDVERRFSEGIEESPTSE
jgi:hypothetical protein